MTNSDCAKGIIGLKQRKKRDDPYMKSNQVLRSEASSVCIGSNIADTVHLLFEANPSPLVQTQRFQKGYGEVHT